ncbi:hypothetical protein EDD18DRAFT_1328970, partial [Armillaria luteobubalina]
MHELRPKSEMDSHSSDCAISPRISFKDPAKTLNQYLKYLCLQTDEIEGTVIVLSRSALSTAFNLLQPNSTTFNLTNDGVCKIHHMLMMSSRVMGVPCTGTAGLSVAYTSIGVTRTNTKVDVTVRAPIRINIQFYPWPDVEEELKIFCKRFNELTGETNIDPFAAAAWINHVFISIHTFEDSNGRLGRILASVQLLRARLPPVCIVQDMKTPPYDNILGSMRSMPRNTNDFEQPVQNLYISTSVALRQLPVSHSRIAKIIRHEEY